MRRKSNNFTKKKKRGGALQEATRSLPGVFIPERENERRAGE